MKLVDAEDIANDKIRTHDLAFEIKTITKQLNTKFLTLHLKNNLCLLNPKPQITKINLHIKNIVHIVKKQIIPSLLVSKNDEMMKTNEMHMLDQNLNKNHLYSTFVLLPTSNDRTKPYDNRYRSQSTSRDNSYNKNSSQNRYRSTSRDIFSYDKGTTPPQYSRSRYDTYKRESRSCRSPYRSSYRSLIDTTLALDIDHAPIPVTTNLQNTQIQTDHLQDQETLDFLDLVHTTIPETKII